MEYITAANAMQNTQPTASLFNEFISYIDRGEKTTRTYIVNLRQFAAWLKYAGITEPVRDDIIQYRQYLTEEHKAIMLDPDAPQGWSYRTDSTGKPLKIKCKPNTVAQYLRSVCQFYQWLSTKGYTNIAAGVHAPKIRHDEHKKDALTAGEVLTIERSIKATAEIKTEAAAEAAKDTAGRIDRATEQGKRLYAMYLLAVNAGMRTIELHRANVGDLELKNGKAALYVWGKGHAEPDTKKPLAHEVYEAIKDYLNSRHDKPTAGSPLFVSTGNRSGGKRIATTTISTMLKRAMQAAGFDSDRLTAHSLRHAAGTNVQEITGNIYLTQQYMRHANPATTEIYLHNDTERQEAETAQKLYEYYHGITQTDAKAQLETLLQAMTIEQLAQLKGIASSMTKYER